MAFRDDREAQLQRAAALERENASLRERLSEREARGAAQRDTEERAALAELERQNRQLRDQLARVRGPSAMHRVLRAMAALRLPAPSGDGGFWRAAAVTWRFHVPLALGFFLPVVALREAWLVLGYALFVVGTPALAALVLLIPWTLRHRRRVTAAGTAGVVVGACGSALLMMPFIVTGELHGNPMIGAKWAVLGLYASVVLLHCSRAVRLSGVWTVPALVGIVFLVAPGPQSFFMPILFLQRATSLVADPR